MPTFSHVSLVNPSFTDRSKVDGLLLITGQVGYAWNAALVYLKGGLAVTDSRYDVLTNPGGVTVVAATATRWGSVVGVGFEYGFAPNWSAGIEYDHLFVGSSSNSFTTPAGLAFATNRISQDGDMFTVRVNYRIGGGSDFLDQRPIAQAFLNEDVKQRTRATSVYLGSIR